MLPSLELTLKVKCHTEYNPCEREIETLKGVYNPFENDEMDARFIEVYDKHSLFKAVTLIVKEFRQIQVKNVKDSPKFDISPLKKDTSCICDILIVYNNFKIAPNDDETNEKFSSVIQRFQKKIETENKYI